VGLLVLIQLVPYGRDHTNPPVQAEPAWDSPRTRELAVRACYDCHSNQTTYPWYSNVAPLSWLIQHDVSDGRRRVNFSEWGRPRQRVDESARVVRRGEMPPYYYVWLHPQAGLTPQEQQELAQGLQATFGSGSEGERGERGG